MLISQKLVAWTSVYQAVLSDSSLHLLQKLVRKFSNQRAEFWQKYIRLKYRFCNKIQVTLVCYAAIAVVSMKFSLNHKLLLARLSNDKDLMELVWVALPSHWHKCCAVPFEIEAKGLIPKQVLWWMLLPAQKHLNIRISTWVQVLVCVNMVIGYRADMVCNCKHDLQIKSSSHCPFNFLCSWREEAELGMDTMGSLNIFDQYVCCNRKQFCLNENALWPLARKTWKKGKKKVQ